MRADDSAPARERLPVLVGAGEIVLRSKVLREGLEPVALMERALRTAEADSGARLLADLDSLDIVNEVSWPYLDAPGLLCARAGLRPRRTFYGVVGGESPVRMVHDAALRIWAGESDIAAVVGAEAQYTVDAAQREGVSLNWGPRNDTPRVRGKDYLHPVAVAHGVTIAANIYPFYENATQAAWGQTPAQALSESAELWSRFSAVAAANPSAWLRRAQSSDEIAAPAPANRRVAWPYTKAMVANPSVNMGAAVVLMSSGEARRRGIPEDRWVYVWGGAAANEPRDYLLRDRFTRSHAQEAVLRGALDVAGIEARQLDGVELYSCFPVVPKMARRVLGLAPSAEMTLTGGLSFFGAPLNNYMTHALAAAMRNLRLKGTGVSLLYGQGEFVTKHHAMVVSSKAPPQGTLTDAYGCQALADASRGPIPPLDINHVGPCTVETYTILYDRSAVRHGVVICRKPDGLRLMARVSADDQRTLSILTEQDVSPVGRTGRTERTADGLLSWSAG
jgi:acetyl-CoA acetyltransferase